MSFCRFVILCSALIVSSNAQSGEFGERVLQPFWKAVQQIGAALNPGNNPAHNSEESTGWGNRGYITHDSFKSGFQADRIQLQNNTALYLNDQGVELRTHF